jgi:site-specific recombinase XerD
MVQLIRATNLDSHLSLSSEELHRFALPDGFYFLVSDEMEIIEPAFFFLDDKCLKSASVSSVGNSQRSYTEDLYEWWSFLEEKDIRWNDVTEDEIIAYRDGMLISYSPHTSRRYKTSTIKRRIGTICQFYEWAFKEGLIAEPIVEKSLKYIPRSLDTNILAHLSVNHGVTQVNPLLPKGQNQNVVNAFTDLKALNQVMNVLGPMPDAVVSGTDSRSTRNRLIAEVSRCCGARIDEVISLTWYQILGLRPSHEDPSRPLKLRITKTKGLIARDILIPPFLVRALHWYYDNERAEVLRQAKVRGKFQKGRSEPAELFLNGIYANARDKGNPVHRNTIERCFNQAVREAGLTRKEAHMNFETSEIEFRDVPAHKFHDLRHTFALVIYYIERANGNPEPWKQIQSLLGHKHLSTTINIYLRSVNVDEAAISNATITFYQILHYA